MSTAHSHPWRIYVDTGGTFTDCVAWDPSGTLHRAKVLSSSALRGEVVGQPAPRQLQVRMGDALPPDFCAGGTFRRLGADAVPISVVASSPDGILHFEEAVHATAGDPFEIRFDEEAPILAARLVTNTAAGRPLPPMTLRLATTRGTNALLERKGARTALFTTAGFGDLLRIGDQTRPDLFALHIEKPTPLHEEVVEVPERLAADGTVLQPLQEESVRKQARHLVTRGVRSAAIAFLHSYRNPDHEHRLAAILREVGFTHVACSADLAPLIRVLPRAQTAEVDAYLGPIIHDYLEKLGASVDPAAVHAMTSAGGLVRPANFHAKDSLLSGPAAGVVGAAAAGTQAGFRRLITFDMGGTSSDVARFDHDVAHVFEHRVGDAHLLAPAVEIETVAAGGGSICAFDGERLTVGPESAGADPGPACYGAGGPLTLTDVNLLLGRLEASRFGIPVDKTAAEARFQDLLAAMQTAGAAPASPDEILQGLVEIADEHMADAIRAVSLRRGYAPSGYALLAFGGAGGQHGCGIAERLGIQCVIVPADTGLLSAVGLGQAPVERIAQRQILRPLHEVAGHLPELISSLEYEARSAVAAEGMAGTEIRRHRVFVFLRLLGQEAALELPWTPDTDLAAAFAQRYRETYGYFPGGRAVEVESIHVSARAGDPSDRGVLSTRVSGQPEPVPEPVMVRSSLWRHGWAETPVYDREMVLPGTQIKGPALIYEAHSVTAVAPRWTLTVDGCGALILRVAEEPPMGRVENRSPREGVPPKRPEAVELELFTARFRSLAAEMGEQLQRTAISTSVKERRDFSCALLDDTGHIIVNAPHIPVHLGAIGLCVREVVRHLALRPGDMVVTNHPAYGGSHLPDITVIAPFFVRGQDQPFAFLVNRAHHAEIGGTRPGSMPPDARNLAEEGVVLPPLHVFRGHEPQWASLRAALEAPPFPSRNVDENLADVMAAVSANRQGEKLLRTMIQEQGLEPVRYYMQRLKGYAAGRMRAALSHTPDGRYEAREQLDDGSPIQVAVTIKGDHAAIDFTGSAPVHPGNLNATRAIVQSAVIYVLRLLVAEPLPLNEGLLDPVDLRIPTGMLNPDWPEDPAVAPAVVAGNTETSQRVIDTLLKAMDLAACSQGTMNNLLFGDKRFGYYETIGGGAGAGPGFAGADAVHTHMTNTRMTDPEILEHRYPVRLEAFAIRRGSGGSGTWKGGDGIRRELTFLAPVSLSIISQHRVERPYGLHGGEEGSPGQQVVIRSDGSREELGSTDGREMQPGDRIVIETPGGGGWGKFRD